MEEHAVQQFGNYHVHHLLGSGGFADVYLGSHIYLERRVAIKVLHAQLVKEESERFHQEARTIARFEHPHIVQILDFGVQAGIPFLVMNYLPNGTLRQRHPRGSQVPIQTVMNYVQQIALALQYAHEQHVIHRDLKPENLLIGARQEIVLSDFGIAVIAQNSLSLHIQEMAGTISYMAPEQIEGRPRLSSDQYALAALVYEWLSGVRPFEGSFVEIAARKSSQPAPPLRARAPQSSPQIEQVVMRALGREPQERFHNVGAFADALRQAGYDSTSQSLSAHHLFSSSSVATSSTPSTSSESPLQQAGMFVPILPVAPVERGLETPHFQEEEVNRVSGSSRSARIRRRDLILAGMGLAALGAGGVAFGLLHHTAASPTFSPVSHETNASSSPIPTSALDRSINSSGTMFGFDGEHTRFNSSERTLSPTIVASLDLSWRTLVGSAITSSPVVANGMVYVGSDDNNLYAFTALDGAKRWAFSTANKIVASPAVARSIVYIGSEDSKFYAISASTGKAYWPPLLMGGQIISSPVVVNGVVYVGSNDLNLHALSATSGQQFWLSFTDYPILSSPAVSSKTGFVYVGSQNGQLYAINAMTGAQVWKYPIGSTSSSSPTIANGIVYIGSDDGLYAMNAATGDKIWVATNSSIPNSSPAVADGVVYIGTDDGLYAFNATDGKRFWLRSSEGAFLSSPTVANGVVYIGSASGKLYAINAADGKPLWSALIGQQIRSSPAVADGVVYVGSDDGYLYAFYYPHKGGKI